MQLWRGAPRADGLQTWMSVMKNRVLGWWEGTRSDVDAGRVFMDFRLSEALGTTEG